MSDSYEIDGVKLTHVGGGYYDLEHSTLDKAERVQGKDKAETKAKEIAAAAQGSDPAGSMPPQGDLPPAAEVQVPPSNEPTTVTVQVEEGAAPPPPASAIPAGVPRSFEGDMSKADKKLLKKSGLGYTKIVLEEQDDIPPTGLFVSHNGRGYQISAGVEVDVPDFILDVLKDAKMSAPIVDSKTRKVVGYRDRMKYPFRQV